MKKLKYTFAFFFIGVFALAVTAQDKKEKQLMKDADKAVKTLLKVNPDLRKYFDSSAGCVIFPNVGKGGLIIGGSSGHGILYEYGKQKGVASLKEISIGAQAGGQALIEVIFFRNASDIQKFKESKYAFDAGISATALKSGVSLDAKYAHGVAVFTHTKGGLMAEVSVGGQRFNYKAF